jgi:hypothetical protein
MTSLSLPVINDVTITATSGTAVTQLFMPATASYETTINNLGFCGVRVYSIVEVPPQNFITITSPGANKQYTNAWTLTFKSLTLADVGVYTVNL